MVTATERVLVSREVCDLVRVSPRTLCTLIADISTSFPKPFKIDGKKNGWLESDVVAYLRRRARPLEAKAHEAQQAAA
jgi:predicted DNA-binding transcriptional regulator AlpA